VLAAVSDSCMKKASLESEEMRPEYDFASLGRGVRRKYAKQLQDVTLVALEPDVAQALRTSAAVNEALGAVLKGKTVIRQSRPVAKRSAAVSRRTKKR
jgi:hypothetical protein